MHQDPSKPMLPKMKLEEENNQLHRLWNECEDFLQKWKAYDFTTEEEPTDAFVAILMLQGEIVARRSYILALLPPEDLPF